MPLLRDRGLLGRVAWLAERNGALDTCPARVREQLAAARVVSDSHRRTVAWETDRIAAALDDLGAPVVLLKGAAYAAAGLPPARGRLASDVDILVPLDYLAAVEAALLQAGWAPVKLDAYDQRYYREWMHELPPLRHTLRGTFVDVHHSILPRTSRLSPSPQKLFQHAVGIPGSRFMILSPADMVLHSAAHLFYDGEFDSGLRDLIDLHDLLKAFGAESGFWASLVPRAVELDLQRPLYYALRYSRRILETPVPQAVSDASRTGAPTAPVRALMDALVTAAIVPRPGTAAARSALVFQVLFVRAHYLRMPMKLLLPHLVRKMIRRGTVQDD